MDFQLCYMKLKFSQELRIIRFKSTPSHVDKLSMLRLGSILLLLTNLMSHSMRNKARQALESVTNISVFDQAKNKPIKQSSPDERSAMPLRGLTLGFGDVTATRENLTTGFGDIKPPEKFEIFEKAVGCCSRVADCFCCMCFIKACSKMNDQCAVVMMQACAALACLGCFECCSELCCGGANWGHRCIQVGVLVLYGNVNSIIAV